MDKEILEAIKAYIYERVKHAKLTTNDAWANDTELLNLYLLLKIIDKLGEIDGHI